MRASITRPAATATDSGRNADNPSAIASAFTNSATASAPCSNRGATVDLPAPFGPATTTTSGLVATSMDHAPLNRNGRPREIRSVLGLTVARLLCYNATPGIVPRGLVSSVTQTTNARAVLQPEVGRGAIACDGSPPDFPRGLAYDRVTVRRPCISS